MHVNSLRIVVVALVAFVVTSLNNASLAQCDGCEFMDDGTFKVKELVDSKDRCRMRKVGFWGTGAPYVGDVPVNGGVYFTATITDTIIIPYDGECDEGTPGTMCVGGDGCGFWFYLKVNLKANCMEWANVWKVKTTGNSFDPYCYIGINYPTCNSALLPPDPTGATGPNPTEVEYDPDPAGGGPPSAPPAEWDAFVAGKCSIAHMLSPENTATNTFNISLTDDADIFPTTFPIFDVTWQCDQCERPSSEK